MTGARTDINKIAACGKVFVGVSRAALEAMAAEKPVILRGMKAIWDFSVKRISIKP